MKTFSRFSIDPLKLAGLALSLWAVLLGSCSQTPVTVTLHSLRASGNVSFVCRGDDRSPAGHKLDECPEYEFSTRRLVALVTQTTTNEIAAIDVHQGTAIDFDPSTPGYSFLRVGAQPGAIVTTPGGAASFVGVTGLGKNGVFALPSSCLFPPKDNEPARDLTRLSACRLSSAPGDITVLVDPPQASGALRASCATNEAQVAPDMSGRECPADLTRETGPVGRRKLLVALPEEHRLVVLDAQSLLDRNPGEFESCAEEASIPLQAQLATTPIVPRQPDDLMSKTIADPDVCPITSYPPPTGNSPTPAGFAVSGNLVYVADRTLPLVHRLDTTDPCAPQEIPPLLSYSYLTPKRVVTTSRVAVSPLTPTGKQFVYAIDETDPISASVMIFDVSSLPKGPESGPKQGHDDPALYTPLLLDNSARQPYLPADRLRFSASVRDVSFVSRDFPASLEGTGVGQFGLTCDPDPNTPDTSQRALYRPNSDFTEGARPLNLRGVFGFAMLTNGQIAVIDVEDFDAPCRRPVTSNASSIEDFRGCANDHRSDDPKAAPPLFYTSTETSAGTPTVTNESSCRVVEPHRPRSASLSISSSSVGLRAPSLRSFPQFSNPDPASVITVAEQPHLLAVDFDGANAQVNVSAQLYAHCSDPSAPPCDSGAKPLELDPRLATQNSITLPLAEPRSYAKDESPALTFEGKVLPDSRSGFLRLNRDGDAIQPTAAIEDPDANFCAAGVEDSQAMQKHATDLVSDARWRDAWSAAHADYVQMTGDFPVSDDAYWRLGQGRFCADWLKNGRGESTLGGDRDACVTEFGNIDDPALLKESRDLSIIEATSSKLSVTPRHCGSDADCALKLAQLACCFPAGTAYTVRASHQWLLSAAAGLHDIGADKNGRCVHTAGCDPRKQFFHSRAFEVCDSTLPFDPERDSDGRCEEQNPNVGCVAKPKAPDAGASGTDQVVDFPVHPGSSGSACIFENLTARFVVYRGNQPSTRGMVFSWQTTGGFEPLSMSLTTQSNLVDPQSLRYLPELGYLGVVDGASLGLTLFDLNSLGVVSPSPFF